MGVLVQIKAGFSNVWMPNGRSYDQGDQVTLSDAQFESLDDPFVTNTLTIVDDGVADPPPDPGEDAVDWADIQNKPELLPRLDVFATPPAEVPYITQLGYVPVISDTDLRKILVNGVETFRQNENGHIRAFFAPGAYSDALIRGVDHASATGWFLEQQNIARDQSLFGVRHNGEIWRTINSLLQKIADLVTTSGATSTANDPSAYGFKLATVPPEIATNSVALTSQTLQLVKHVVQQTILVSNLRAYRQAAGATPVAGYNGYGIYSDDGTTLTLIAQTADDTTLWTGTSWGGRNLVTPVTLDAGKAYWFAMLGNHGTAPTVRATTGIGNQGVLNSGPGGLTTATAPGSLTALPATITKATLTGSTQRWLIGAT